MTLLKSQIAVAQKHVFDDIVTFQSTALKTSGYLEAVILANIALNELGHASTIFDAYIEKAASSKLAFKSLKRASAHYILHDKQMPERLKTWTVDYLHETAHEPTTGKSGPNKSELEHVLLLNCVDKVIALTGLSIYPRESTGLDNCALGIIAAASAEAKRKTGTSVFPTKPKTMERRYLKAKKWAENRR